MLEVGNRVSFDKKGNGTIKTQNYNIKWYDIDQDSSFVGETDETKYVSVIYKGKPYWDFKYYIPVEIIEKLKAFESKKIKAEMTISLLYTYEDGTVEAITKKLFTTFELPE